MIYANIDLIIDNRHLEAKLAELASHAQKVDLNWDEKKILELSLNIHQQAYMEMILNMSDCIIKDLENKKAEKESYLQTKSARINFKKQKLFTRFRKKGTK